MTEPIIKQPTTDHGSLKWLDALKAFAVLWIFLNHAVERVLGSPYIANPHADWPPLSDRIFQLAPVDYGGATANAVLNLCRYLGWAGDQGVQLFLIASGFGLTLSLLKRGYTFDWGGFYRRRLGRIYPLWWGAHIAFLIPSFIFGQGMQLFDVKFLLSFLGFRATPELMYYFAPAWWYIGLIIQLYLAYPLLAAGLRRLGAVRFLCLTLGVSFLVRFSGLYVFDGYLDAWSRGGIFVTRLPEFVVGMALAWWWHRHPGETDRWLRRPATLILATLAYVVAVGLSLTLWGMTFAPFLQGIALFAWLYTAFRLISDRPWTLGGILMWVGAHSYSLYLVHHPVILFSMGRTNHPTLTRLAIGLPALGLSLVCALALEWIVSRVPRAFTGWAIRLGTVVVITRLVAMLVALATVIIAAEVAVRTLDPQEVYGWGERPSLQPHEEFGWRLIPNQTTRLRWESYDYVVRSNELGFPGPLYPEARTPDTYRIMTLGDAFTSAEGVDTGKAWPRLLERKLAADLAPSRVEVLNFAITGYGPNQFVAVLEEYCPRYRPDLILVGFFVNEYFDVLLSNDEFRGSIGFHSSAQDGLRGYVEAAHLRQWIRLRIGEPLRDQMTRSSRSHGYFLGNFASLETGNGGITETGRELVAQRLGELARLAEAANAEIVLLLIPAPVQICGPDSLRYFPSVVEIDDRASFDMDRPQLITQQIARELGLVAYDLRKPLGDVDACPYQPRNMHWLAEGHEAVADYVRRILIRDGHTPTPSASKDE